MKWYENKNTRNDVFAAARVRLVRNLEGVPFPGKLSETEAEGVNHMLRDRLSEMTTASGKQFRYYELDQMTEVERRALQERKVINETLASKTGPAALLTLDDESMSISMNGDDHIRIQCISTDVNLDRIWTSCDQMDDYINRRFTYAYHEKYGYLTAFPTNMGTGLRVSVFLHLPFLSMGKQFRKLVGEVGRFGIRVKGVFGEGAENYGSLYEVSNQKTLGQSEGEIISLVYRMASHLAANERRVRALALRENRVALEDEAYKSYGVLKYARQLSFKEAMMYLSHVRVGLCEGLLQMEQPVNIFGYMLNQQDANLRARRIGEVTQEELNQIRAESMRDSLPSLV